MGWHHNDLTVAASAPLPGVNQGMTAYAFEDKGTQRVIYIGQDFHINELWWDSSGWHHNDLTVAASAPLPSINESISAYAFEDQGTQHNIYVGQDLHTNELWWASMIRGIPLCPLWIISGHLHCNRPCLLYPRRRPWMRTFRMSALGQ